MTDIAKIKTRLLKTYRHFTDDVILHSLAEYLYEHNHTNLMSTVLAIDNLI